MFKLTNDILYKPTKPAEFDVVEANYRLVKEMITFMEANHGIGLAANQIGIDKSLFVMKIDGKEWGCFNPSFELVSPSYEDKMEGCLSFPGETKMVRRHSSIIARYYDYKGIGYSEIMSDRVARCFQHEYDHLQGITMHEQYQMWKTLKKQKLTADPLLDVIGEL